MIIIQSLIADKSLDFSTNVHQSLKAAKEELNQKTTVPCNFTCLLNFCFIFQMNSIDSFTLPTCDAKNCIQLAACSANQLLSINPELPADLFTACRITPIKVALQWFCHQGQVPYHQMSLLT